MKIETMLAGCSGLDEEDVKNSFLLYKKVTKQYQDLGVLRSVKELIPENVECNLVSLLKWFKSFMQWMPKQLVCNSCAAGTDGSDESQFMQAEIFPSDSPLVRKVEVHTCKKCGAKQLFPRYNDILEIAKARKGRCSEWSILFGAILSSVSLEARIVHDYLDHCWNEVKLDGKWIHADSTLDYPTSFDHPHFYEKNWKKNYLYVIAFTSEKIDDVTQKYTDHWNDILTKRQNLVVSLDLPTSITELENLYDRIKIK